MIIVLKLLFQIALFILTINIWYNEDYIQKSSFENKCNFVFSWSLFILDWKNWVDIGKAFPNNTWSIEPVDKDSFVLIYSDKSLYSNILCYYKDKNYTYWLVADYLLPLFSWFDYDSLKIITWYNETPTLETCIWWGCFEDENNIYISEWLWWNEPFAWRYDKIMK